MSASREKLPSLEGVTSKDDLSALYERAYPEATRKTRGNYVGQLWSLVSRMQVGELVVLPLKTTGTIAVGRITSPYRYRTDLGDDMQHTREVEWIRTDLARDSFNKDLLNSFGAYLTFGRVQRDRAEERILATFDGTRPETTHVSEEGSDEADVIESPDIEGLGREQIRQYVSERFAGHELTRLVGAILEGLGFTGIEISPPGADQGVDIVAGTGPMGLDSPRVVVQVKTGQAGIDEYRSLRGLVENLRADQGLLVAWGGFRGTVRKEARQTHFTTRLWDADALLDEMFSVHERLSDDLRSELPLKRVWALVPPE